MLEFRAPYPLSLNRLYRTVQGRMLLSKEGRAYKEQVGWLAKAAGAEKPLLGWIDVTLVLHPVEPKDAEKRAAKFGPHWHLSCRCLDIDNALKATVDAMQGIVYADDSQLVSLIVQRGMPVPDGGVTVKVAESMMEAA